MDVGTKTLEAIFRSAKIELAYHVNYAGEFFGASHRHPTLYHLSYVVSGKSQVKIGRKIYQIKERDVVFVNANEVHCSYPETEREKFDLLEIKFFLNEKPVLEIPGVISVRSCREFQGLFHELINEFHMNKPYREVTLNIYLTQLFVLLYRQLKEKSQRRTLQLFKETDGKKQDKINQAITFIQTNYIRKITLKDIAQEVTMSPSSLSHTFEEVAGISPINYLINYRLSQALWLMEKTTHKISDIAKIVGFGDQYYFSRFFKKRYHLSPRNYVRCNRPIHLAR